MESGPLVLNLVQSWRLAASAGPLVVTAPQSLIDLEETDANLNLDYDDPVAILLREHKAEKQKHQEAKVVSERRLGQRQASQQEKGDEEERLREWHASEQYRHAMEAIYADVDDARQATVHSRERALVEQQQAREALEEVQHKALVVDGSRVYFTRDGSRLYGEDDRQITDSRTLAQAEQQRQTKPGATTYEDYADRTKANRVAADKVQKLDEAAVKLDELDKRIKKGNLSPEDLAQARQDKQDVIDALPAEARAEYERLHEAKTDERKLAYKSADPAFTSAPDISASFQQAVAATVSPKEPASQPPGDRRNPVYKAAPDY